MNYEKIYNDIISKAKAEDRKKIKGGIYYEAHHIIPKCMGGEGMTYQHSHSNIILLTAKEHYMAHKLLCEIYPDNNKLRYALWCMVNGLNKTRYMPSGRIYTRLRQSFANFKSESSISRKVSEETRKKMSNSQKSRSRPPISEETRLKMSIAQKNKAPMSEETKKKIGNSNKGKIISDDHKKRMSDTNKGKIISSEIKKKLSIAAKNRPLRGPISEETKKKISDATRGKIVSEETRKKISESNKGRIAWNKRI